MMKLKNILKISIIITLFIAGVIHLEQNKTSHNISTNNIQETVFSNEQSCLRGYAVVTSKEQNHILFDFNGQRYEADIDFDFEVEKGDAIPVKVIFEGSKIVDVKIL